MFCTKCGSKLPDDAKFCTACGTPVDAKSTAAEDMIAKAAANAADTQNMPFSGAGGGIGGRQPLMAEGSLNGGKKKKPYWIILAAAIVFLAAGLTAGGAYIAHNGGFNGFFGSGGAEDDDEPDEDVKKKKKETKEEESKAEEEEEKEEEEEEEENEATAKKAAPEEQIPISINVRQVDNANFPDVTLYATVTDEQGNVVEDIETSDFTIQEIDRNGNVTKSTLKEVEKALGADDANVNLVLDASDSMNEYSKMDQAKQAAEGFLNQVDLDGGDKVEIISFNSFVYLEQSFTSRYQDLYNALYGIDATGMTALYDAIYAGLIETYNQDGAKCVIAFTDGLENASSYTFDDVVSLAQNTGIPVFIIGIGDAYDEDTLRRLASQCSGNYYAAEEENLSTILEDIYMEIYREQQDYYVFRYTSTNLDNQDDFRTVKLATTETADFSGSYEKEYVPVADLSGGFSSDYASMDFMIEDSSERQITEADLQGMSLAQLRIARNEIYARHGRQFKDSMLNKWFYSKNWYLDIPLKYAPDDFDSISPPILSKLEQENAKFILAYENSIMETEDIYPNAASELLSEYDLYLSDAVLKRAMAQLDTYPSTQTLEENKILIQEAIDREDIEY